VQGLLFTLHNYVGHYIVNDAKDVDEVIFKSCDTFLVKIPLYLHKGLITYYKTYEIIFLKKNGCRPFHYFYFYLFKGG
jgi:hypothetical protein